MQKYYASVFVFGFLQYIQFLYSKCVTLYSKYVLKCVVCSPLVPKFYIQWESSPSHWQCYTHTHTHTDSSLHSLLPSHPSGLDSTHLAWAREFQQSVLFILLSFILTDILWLRALCLSLSLSSEHQGVRKGGMQGRNLLPKYVNN